MPVVGPANDNATAIFPLDGVVPGPDGSDDALTQAFTTMHGENWRYVAAIGRWRHYAGGRWIDDELRLVFDMIRIVCRDEANVQSSYKAQRAIASKKTISAVEFLARSDRQLAAPIAAWDASPWLLNTPTGTFDLSTGTCFGHDPNDYLTKMTAVAPCGDCPLWIDTLRTVFNADDALIDFFQRVAGYMLTGRTTEHAMFFGFGLGRNGKSTVVNALSGVMGSYACTAPMDTFTANDGNRHPTELAGLVGKRLVIASEVEDGQRWNEARIKSLTGGDEITARFMRQDFFSFKPEFKLFVIGNHQPGLRHVDEAIRRRMHMIPFEVTISKESVDPDLGDKLRPEWPGILAWAIDGAKKWLADGLHAPAVVRSATEDYLSEQDTFGIWLDECCETEYGARDFVANLFENWKRWVDRRGEFAGSTKRFSQRLRDRGYLPCRQPGTGLRMFSGLRIKYASEE